MTLYPKSTENTFFPSAYGGLIMIKISWTMKQISINLKGSISRLGRSLGEGHGNLLGASVRHSARGKGHEEGGSTYAKMGSSLRSPPGNPRTSTPITRACLLYYFVLSPTPLTLLEAVPHHLFQRRS